MQLETYVDMQHLGQQQVDLCFLVSMDTGCKQDSRCHSLCHKLHPGTYTHYHQVFHCSYTPIHCLVHYTGSMHQLQLLSQHNDAAKVRKNVLKNQILAKILLWMSDQINNVLDQNIYLHGCQYV